MFRTFMEKLRENRAQEYKRKYFEVRGALIDYFDKTSNDLIPSWMKADKEIHEWEQRGIIEEKYKVMVRYGLVA